tara:strand:+ start:211 stop:498 length:288 start_codon:yes stop_codon:yes gene_type:complete
MSKITSGDVEKVAKLARLNLSKDEIDSYTNQLEKILDYIEQLDSVNTEGIPPTTRAVEVINKVRDDKVDKTTVREELLDLAPLREGDFFKVPKIL